MNMCVSRYKDMLTKCNIDIFAETEKSRLNRGQSACIYRSIWRRVHTCSIGLFLAHLPSSPKTAKHNK